jgi:flavorubredoxin
MKKALILYDSVYGNTKKLAMSLGRGLESGGIYVDVIHIQEFELKEVNKYDLIAIGGPTHFHGASKQMKLFLSKLKHLRLNDKLGLAFETKVDFSFSGSAAKRIIRYLNKMKVRLVYPTITGIVLDKEGPLENSTSTTMEQIGLVISEKVNTVEE